MTYLKFVAASAAMAALAACGSSEPAAPAPAETPASPSVQATEPPAQPAAAEPEPAEPSPEFAALPAPYNAADYSLGRRTYRLCSSCHVLAEGGGNLVGPNLHGLFGRPVAAVEDFQYSNALQEADFVWSPEELDNWLANPRSFLPGNRMSFAGVRRQADRDAVIAYLMVETGWTPPPAE